MVMKSYDFCQTVHSGLSKVCACENFTSLKGVECMISIQYADPFSIQGTLAG